MGMFGLRGSFLDPRLVGQGNPLVAAGSCLLFAYVGALSVGIQNLGIPSQLVETLPYVATILVLLIYGSRNLRQKKAEKPARGEKARSAN